MTTKLSLPYFGDIDTRQDEYTAEIELEGHEVDVFINELTCTEAKQIDIMLSVLNEIERYHQANIAFIEQDLQNHPEVSIAYEYLSNYIEHYQDVAENDIDSKQIQVSELRKLIADLQLQTISFYSDAVIFDYCIDAEVSDQLLVVNMQQGQRSIMWES